MRQQIPVLLATLLVLALGWVGYRWVFGARAGIVLQVMEVSGTVTRIPGEGGGAEHASAGLLLGSSDALRVGADSRAVVGIGEDTRLTLAADSSIRVIEADATGVRIELEEGRVSARVRPGSAPLELSSRGRTARASDADFTVASASDGAFAVEATRGEVAVSGVEGLSKVQTGQRLTDVPGSRPQMGSIPAALLLSVNWPTGGAVRAETVVLSGTTDPYAQVTVRGGLPGSPPARAGPDGSFSTTVALEEGNNAVSVEVQDVVGNKAEAKGALLRDSTAPAATRAEVLWRQ